MKKMLKKLVARGRFARDKMEQYQETITFSEAGQAESAAASPENVPAEEQPGLLLVIGNGNTFSRRLMDYALEMARRLSYEILALNIAPLPAETSTLLPPPQNKIREFEKQSEENARAFQEAARQAGVPFNHTVKFGETDTVIHEIDKEYGTIEFVISEPSREQVSNRPEKENRPEKQLHVYSLA
ncbi:MAG: universal stress protein [Desulfosudaceae bacterium]